MLTLAIKNNQKIKLDNQKIDEACKYISNYWPVLTRTHHETTDTLMGLPNSYIVPADERGNFRFNEQYYWDSYFIALGLLACGQNSLAEGMLENLFYMLERLKLIPNGSRLYMTSRSQPPILTSFILLIFESNKKDKAWLQRAACIAQEEYLTVWRSETHPHWREVYAGLSRYYDVNVLHDLAEAESGWDMTPRFNRRALDYLPIDLNCLLYKYETDFAKIALILEDTAAAEMWQERANLRRQTVNDLMWSSLKKFYFDFDFINGNQGPVWSLAAYYSMWVGLADHYQAEQLVKHLNRFEQKGGLSVTPKNFIDMSIFGSLKTQWAYPNGWAPLHYIVIEGLKNYGYHKEASVIGLKWLATNLNWFTKNGVFLEKYNVVNPDKPPYSGVYPTQTGFGWTNAVFISLIKENPTWLL